MSRARVEEFEVDVPGGQVYGKRWRPETDSGKAPVILLHDSLGGVDLWRDFPARLAESLSRCVVAYDRLGFGQSDARVGSPSTAFIAEEATRYFPAIKEGLSLQGYILFGHSVGGAMAVHIAARDPDCLAVVTVSAQAFIEDCTVKGVRQAKQMFEQPGQIERLEKWHGKKASWVLHAWTDIWLSPSFRNWSLKPAIQRVQCPLLAIHGDSDEYGSTAFPEFITKNAGGPATMLILDRCGHMPHKEKPGEVIGATAQLLSETR